MLASPELDELEADFLELQKEIIFKKNIKVISYIEEWTDEESDLDPENEEDRENLVNIVELPIEELSPKSSWFTKT